MKAIILAAIAATVLASAISVQAAERRVPLDGYKLFNDIANRGN